MSDLNHIRSWEDTGQSGELLARLFGTHWGLLPASMAAPILAQTTDPMGLLVVLLAAIMASYDVAERRIPNTLTALTAIIGIGYTATLGLSALGWGLVGGLVGLSMMGLFYIFGAVGAGDVKAMAAISIFLGPQDAILLFITTTICGGLMALARLIAVGNIMQFRNGLSNLYIQRTGMTLPYGLAILAGTIWVITIKN